MADADTPTCYICMEEASGTNPFLTRSMCACSSKAGSSLKVHQLCLELCRDRSGNCAVCKSPLDGNWAFDGRFKVDWQSDAREHIVITQMKKKVKHGAYYILGESDAYQGPIRYLSSRGTFKEGKLQGSLITFHKCGAVYHEENYEDGVLHGASVIRDKTGAVLSESNFVHGKRHGLHKSFWNGIEMGGTYENGAKIGLHVERAEAYLHIRRANYVAGLRDGPCIEYHVEAGEGLPTLVENYRAGQIHGLEEIWDVDVSTLTRTLRVEAHWVDGKKNGRRAVYNSDGQLISEKHYHMDLEHGVQRTYEGGQLMEEITFNMGTKHGRHRVWTMVRGRRVEFMDGSYDNGWRHGRHRYHDFHGRCHLESYWSDGTQELRHGTWTVSDGPKVNSKGDLGETLIQESHWNMGQRHGRSRKWEGDQLIYELHHKDGQLDGTCRLWTYGQLVAIGNYKAGVAVGRQQLFTTGTLTEDVNYDEAGQFHGTCSYYNSDGSRFQVLQFKHGVLHGRQCFYRDGRLIRVIGMRDGHVQGRFTVFDERGVETSRIVRRGELDFADAMDGGVLCAPCERTGRGFEFRYQCRDGAIVACKLLAGGPSCNCADCTKPSWACSCSWCDVDYDEDYEEERYEAFRDRYRYRSRYY